VRVRINWDTARIEPNGASVYFFPKKGGNPYILWTNHTSDSLYLPVGNYSVLVFNERVNEHTDIAFRGTHSYETFEVYALPDYSIPDFLQYQAQVNHDMSKATKLASTANPDVLAVARMNMFCLTHDMTLKGVGPLLEFTPLRVTAELLVTVRIRGLQYAAVPSGCGGSICGMSEGMMLATGQPNLAPTTQYLTFRRADFDPDSRTEGVMQAVFNTFGPLLEQDVNLLWMQFLLRDGSIYTPDMERDVTGHFEMTDLPDRKWLDLSVGRKRWDNDDPITLPYAKPEDGIFDVGVNGWEEGEVVDTKL
jgi:hypothetical protein